MLFMALMLVLASSNGWAISPWCWFILGVQVFLEMLGLVAKIISKKMIDNE